MLKRLSHRLNHALGRTLPEQRLFLKSDSATRFIRLSPATQGLAALGCAAILGWTIVATSILAFETISAGSGREQAERQQALYESRLNALSIDRDLRSEEAARAQERFTLALKEVSQMQTRLLASEDRRRELESGIDVIQETLRRTIRERDEARGKANILSAELKEETGSTLSADARIRDASATVEMLSNALTGTAAERDSMADVALLAREEASEIAEEKRQLELRNDMIFTRLEEAVSVSMEPLNKMFRAAGLSPDEVLRTVRRGYSGQGGPLLPIKLSTSGGKVSEEEIRANAILEGLDHMNLYRLAAQKAPFANPVRGSFRFTSGYGYRRDPKGAGTRMHAGTDFAGSQGTPIVATGDGVVIHAAYNSGYGRHIKIRHELGIETLYAHLSNIRVKVGQKVSRGERIGDMGSTGRSTGTHLHYEVRVGNKPVNPMTFIKAATDVF